MGHLNIDFQKFIQSLEDEIAKTDGSRQLEKNERAVLVGVTPGPGWKVKENENVPEGENSKKNSCFPGNAFCV